MPTRLRWPTATAMIRGGEILLFDCGEGTQLQFQKARLKPGKLTKIFITHFHGDHFYGLIGLLTSLQLGGRKNALHLYGPKGLDQYLEFMQKLSHFTFGYDIFIHEVAENDTKTVWDFEEYQVIAKPLQHSLFVLGFRLEEKPKPGKFNVLEAEKLGVPAGPQRKLLQEGISVRIANGREILPSEILGPEKPGKTITFCLDTRPCKNSVELAKDADLLIHDGTFDESKQDWAELTGHSTVVQTAEIAKEAVVKSLVLTHISARYEEKDFVDLLVQAQRVFPNTILGHDLLRIVV